MVRVEALITGAAESPYRRHPDREVTTLSLLADACRRALEDAGREPHEVDGLGVASFSLAPDHSIDVAARLGLRVSWLMDAATGGASGSTCSSTLAELWRPAMHGASSSSPATGSIQPPS